MIRLRYKTILGDIPSDWTCKPLASVLSDKLPGDWGDDEGEVLLSVLRSTNFTDSGNLDRTDIATRAFSAVKAKQIQVQVNDILIERSGGGPNQPVGRVAMIREEMPLTGFANFIQLLRPNPEDIDPDFLLWVLHQLNRSGFVERLQNQTTQMRNLDLRDYLQVMIPIPPEPERMRIAGILRSADDHITTLEHEIVTAERVSTALDQAHFSPTIKEIRFPYEFGTDRSIPKNWKPDQLGRVADITSGITLNQDREAAANGVRYLTVVNVYRGRIDRTEVRHLELRGTEAYSKILNESDILVVEGHANPAEIGRAALVTDREAGMSFQNHLFRIRVNDENELRPRFLVRVLNS